MESWAGLPEGHCTTTAADSPKDHPTNSNFWPQTTLRLVLVQVLQRAQDLRSWMVN